MTERVRLAKKEAPPRARLSAAAKWNGWELEEVSSVFYSHFLACYDGRGIVERHGFKSLEAAREFADVHPAPVRA